MRVMNSDVMEHASRSSFMQVQQMVEILKREQQRLKKTGQFSYVMAVELFHIFGAGGGVHA